MLDLIKKPFDPVALAVEGRAEAMVVLAVDFARDIGSRSLVQSAS